MVVCKIPWTCSGELGYVVSGEMSAVKWGADSSAVGQVVQLRFLGRCYRRCRAPFALCYESKLLEPKPAHAEIHAVDIPVVEIEGVEIESVAL